MNVPEDIYDLSRPYAVDSLIDLLSEPRRRIRLHNRWQRMPRDHLAHLIRRSVEIAILQADNAAQEALHAEHAEKWMRRQRSADLAAASILEFMKHISGLGSKALIGGVSTVHSASPVSPLQERMEADVILGEIYDKLSDESDSARRQDNGVEEEVNPRPVAAIESSEPMPSEAHRRFADRLFSFHNFTTARGNVSKMIEMSEDDAKAFFRVFDILQRYGPYAAGHAKSINQGRSGNQQGKPVKAAFVRALAESWVGFTGRIPGRGANANPFLWFVSAAWEATGEQRGEDFVHPMRSAIAELQANFNDGSETRFVP